MCGPGKAWHATTGHIHTVECTAAPSWLLRSPSSLPLLFHSSARVLPSPWPSVAWVWGVDETGRAGRVHVRLVVWVDAWWPHFPRQAAGRPARRANRLRWFELAANRGTGVRARRAAVEAVAIFGMSNGCVFALPFCPRHGVVCERLFFLAVLSCWGPRPA